jgi:hypothetical protein
MSHYEQFTAAIASGVVLSVAEQERVTGINAMIPGYSDTKHYTFFRELVALPEVREILILGVYHGRDIAYMRDNIVRCQRTDRIHITGVDKFSDTPCADWPDASRNRTWTEAGFGPPPSLAKAKHNLGFEYLETPRSSGGDYAYGVTLIESDDEKFLAETDQQFDVVYIDTSHDAGTITRQLRQVPRVCRGDALICGDDYSDQSNAGGSWGVKTAVGQAFTSHVVFAEWIWVSSLSLLKS